jgi:hypothetical protein
VSAPSLQPKEPALSPRPRHRAPETAARGATAGGRTQAASRRPLLFLATAFSCAALLIAAPLAIVFSGSGGSGLPGGSSRGGPGGGSGSQADPGSTLPQGDAPAGVTTAAQRSPAPGDDGAVPAASQGPIGSGAAGGSVAQNGVAAGQRVGGTSGTVVGGGSGSGSGTGTGTGTGTGSGSGTGSGGTGTGSGSGGGSGTGGAAGTGGSGSGSTGGSGSGSTGGGGAGSPPTKPSVPTTPAPAPLPLPDPQPVVCSVPLVNGLCPKLGGVVGGTVGTLTSGVGGLLG